MKNSIEFFLNNHLGWALGPHNYTLTLDVENIMQLAFILFRHIIVSILLVN